MLFRHIDPYYARIYKQLYAPFDQPKPAPPKPPSLDSWQHPSTVYWKSLHADMYSMCAQPPPGDHSALHQSRTLAASCIPWQRSTTICSICEHIMNEPVMLFPCTHCFCRVCAVEALAGDKHAHCMRCSQPATEMRPSQLILDMIADFAKYDPNWVAGPGKPIDRLLFSFKEIDAECHLRRNRLRCGQPRFLGWEKFYGEERMKEGTTPCYCEECSPREDEKEEPCDYLQRLLHMTIKQ